MLRNQTRMSLKHLKTTSLNLQAICLRTNANGKQKVFISDKYTKLSRDNVFGLSRLLAKQMQDLAKRENLLGEKVAVLCPNNYTYLLSLLATWLNSGIAVGLNRTYPINTLKYFLNDSKAKFAVNAVSNDACLGSYDQSIVELLNAEHIKTLNLPEADFYRNASTCPDTDSENFLSFFNNDNDSLILYTSGSSGPPKGVVLTNRNLRANFEAMISKWKWTPADTILHMLPLNHVHGLLNCLLTPLYANASVLMLEKFNAEVVWHSLLDANSKVNIVQAVPTIYVQLLDYYHKNKALQDLYSKDRVKQILTEKIRVMIAGSAPLNAQTYNDWYDLTGHKILERYGMTEIGMALTSPYDEEKDFKRIAGLVGRPLPSVRVRIVDALTEDSLNPRVLIESDETYDHVKTSDSELSGNLEIKGPNVFREYLNKEKATRESFTHDGWFITGDSVAFIKENRSYKILGRTSVDIIKSGGYKISAVDIEREISANKNIADVIVFGVKNLKWGEIICAYLKPHGDLDEFDQDEFLKWCKERMPKQNVPKIIKLFKEMPRNHIGKVNKKELIKQYEKENQIA
jgi:malonyl-CoA/methylmalonyl-CoA synthetase